MCVDQHWRSFNYHKIKLAHINCMRTTNLKNYTFWFNDKGTIQLNMRIKCPFNEYIVYSDCVCVCVCGVRANVCVCDGNKVHRISSSLHLNLSAKYCYINCTKRHSHTWLAASIEPITEIKYIIFFVSAKKRQQKK